MNSGETLAVVRRFHDGWTSEDSDDFEDAVALLASNLKVEGPYEYSTGESYRESLRGFRERVGTVELISEMSNPGEAMLLYNMEIAPGGPALIVQHFTVADGKITRIIQVFDPADSPPSGARPTQ